VTPFPVFEEHWDPNTVITPADDHGGTLEVTLPELLCLTLKNYKDKVTKTLNMKFVQKLCSAVLSLNSWQESSGCVQSRHFSRKLFPPPLLGMRFWNCSAVQA